MPPDRSSRPAGSLRSIVIMVVIAVILLGAYILFGERRAADAPAGNISSPAL